jgi:hypothetical protein
MNYFDFLNDDVIYLILAKTKYTDILSLLKHININESVLDRYLRNKYFINNNGRYIDFGYYNLLNYPDKISPYEAFIKLQYCTEIPTLHNNMILSYLPYFNTYDELNPIHFICPGFSNYRYAILFSNGKEVIIYKKVVNQFDWIYFKINRNNPNTYEIRLYNTLPFEIFRNDDNDIMVIKYYQVIYNQTNPRYMYKGQNVLTTSNTDIIIYLWLLDFNIDVYEDTITYISSDILFSNHNIAIYFNELYLTSKQLLVSYLSQFV